MYLKGNNKYQIVKYNHFDRYLVLNIVRNIEDETIVRVVWAPQLQLVQLDRDQVSFHLNFDRGFNCLQY